MISLVLTALLLAGPPGGTVRGQLFAEGAGPALSHATVEIVGSNPRLIASSSADGSYVLRNVPPGRRLLRARQLGYRALDVEILVPEGGEVVLDLLLERQPIAFPAVTVPVRSLGGAPLGRDSIAAAAPDLALAGQRVLDASPGFAELGLGGESAQSPGQEPVDPSDVLYVRGASADLKLVLLDGAPVYAPFHLGGLVPPFEPAVLASARLFLGGAPARYDGGLSYVMDLRSRSGRNAFHSSGAADLLSSRLLVEGPVGSARVLAGGRAVHGFGGVPLTDSPGRYAYADGLARVDVPLFGGVFSASGYRNHEGVRLDQGAPAGWDGMAHWSNSSASLRYGGTGGGGDYELTAAFGGYQAHLPLGGSEDDYAQGGTRRFRLAGEHARDEGPVALRYGASLDRYELRFTTTNAPVRSAARQPSDSVVAHTISGFADASWQPVPELRLRTGLRADLFTRPLQSTLAPRLSATWLLNERAALSLSAGRYHQYVRPAEEIVPTAGASSDTLVASAELAVAEATHFSVGLTQEFTAGLRLGVEGFFKRFDNLPAAGQSNAAANASGLDLSLRRDGAPVSGWFGYSLAWVWAEADRSTSSDAFIGRQLISAGISAPLGRFGKLEVRALYGAGLPYTAISDQAALTEFSDAPRRAGEESALQSAEEEPPLIPDGPDRPYFRLDVDISRTWSAKWRGTPFQVTPYLRVLNALDRRDALFFRIEDAAPEPLSPLPVLPVLGVEWRF